jgi:hypothetical protein
MDINSVTLTNDLDLEGLKVTIELRRGSGKSIGQIAS